MRKGIVLLITLFFITTISVLILKNLDDSNSYLENQLLDTNLIQSQIIHENVIQELTKLTADLDDESLESLFEVTAEGIPMEYGDITLFIRLGSYIVPTCNLNDIKKIEDFEQNCPELIEFVNYPYEFIEYVKKEIKYISQKQVDFLIDKYSIDTQDEKILEVKEEFGFLTLDENATLIECYYEADFNNIKLQNEIVYEKGSKTVKIFDMVLR